jgi:hypothetical protein
MVHTEHAGLPAGQASMPKELLPDLVFSPGTLPTPACPGPNSGETAWHINGPAPAADLVTLLLHLLI